jgi:DNA polymerase
MLINDVATQAAVRLNLTRGRDSIWRGRCPVCGCAKPSLEVAVQQDGIAVSCSACGADASAARMMGLPSELVVVRRAQWKVARALDASRNAVPGATALSVRQINTVAAPAQHVLHRDYETRSTLNLQNVGPWKYASGDDTDVWCCAYAVDLQPVKLWRPGDPIPPEFTLAAADPSWLLCAHNAQFEIAIEYFIMQRRYGWPKTPLQRQRCTMAAALALALPTKLELLAEALELLHRKDKAGQRLMLLMSKPRRPRKGEDPKAICWYDDDDRIQRLGRYCCEDVESEREAYQQLRPLSPQEQQVWLLDLRINARGFHIDRGLAVAAYTIAKAAAPELNAELTQLTGGAATSINQVARLKLWLAQQGCKTDSLDKAGIKDLLGADNLALGVRRALELRQSGAQAAAKKIDSLLARCDRDSRIRGALRYHGASTGRWAGNGVQPQNLKRPQIEDVNAAVAAIATGDYTYVRGLYPKPLAVIGDISRSMICAVPGHELIGADFSSIESRVLAWIGDEAWKLDSYCRFDATRDSRDEPYCIAACKIFRVPDGTFNADSPERRIGKTCDLAFGYQGGLRAWRKFEPNRFSDAEVEQFKFEWRATHPQIKKFWYAINRATLQAVREREHVIQCSRLLLKCSGMFLFIKLPSGHKLAYPFPSIEVKDLEHEVVVFKDASSGQWRDCRGGDGAYGGLWTENIVSAISRDLLAAALIRVERAGYRVVLHIHDEILSEVPIGFGSTEEFTKLMTVSPSWAVGLPIAAKAWCGPRFCRS